MFLGRLLNFRAGEGEKRIRLRVPVSTLSEAVLRKYPNPVFVETGTHEGGGIMTALSVGFRKVVSIEVDRKAYEKARRLFNGDPRVTLVLGDSLEVLERVIEKIKDPITFWLDAHGSGWSPNGGAGKKNCPLLEELAAIAAHPVKRHTILIDDRRMLGEEGTFIEDITGVRIERTWGISEREVIDALRAVLAQYEISYENGSEPFRRYSRKSDIIVAQSPEFSLSKKFT